MTFLFPFHLDFMKRFLHFPLLLFPALLVLFSRVLYYHCDSTYLLAPSDLTLRTAHGSSVSWVQQRSWHWMVFNKKRIALPYVCSASHLLPHSSCQRKMQVTRKKGNPIFWWCIFSTGETLYFLDTFSCSMLGPGTGDQWLHYSPRPREGQNLQRDHTRCMDNKGPSGRHRPQSIDSQI